MAESKKSFSIESDEADIDVGEEEGAGVEVEIESFADDASKPDFSNEQEDYQGAAQKRINRLTKKMRDAERREQEAIRYAQQVTEEAQTLQARVKQLDTGYLHEYGGRLDIETKTAEGALKRAVEIGDSDGVIENQRKLNQLYAAAEKYREAKRGQEMREAQVANQAQYAPQQYAPQQQPQQQQIIRPDPKAETWAERNTWFGQDEAMTFAAFGIHKKLIEEEGFDPQTDEYYSELDQRLRKRFPQEFASTPANDSGSSRRPVQTVAGVSRSSQTTGRGANAKVRLTPTQVAIAKKLGVPLDHYARYVKD